MAWTDPLSALPCSYCDMACNTTDCEYDGGDCVGKDAKMRGGYSAWQGHSNSGGGRGPAPKQCATGCSDNWLGDKYCDRACNVVECGFDGGDCGIPKVGSAQP